MKKTLCISTHLYPTNGFGGPAISFSNFLDYLKEHNHYFTAISSTHEKSYNNKDKNFTRIYFKSRYFLKYGYSFQLFLYLFKNSNKYDNFIINGVTNFPLFFAIICAYFYKKKVFIFTRGGLEISRVNEWNFLKRTYYQLNIFFLNLINKHNNLTLVYQSQDEKNISNIKCQNTVICSNYSENFFKDTKKNFKTLSVLYVGRFSPEKGSDRLIELMNFFKNNITFKNTLYLAIASNTKIIEFEDFISTNNINIQYNLDINELDELYKNTNIIFFPSYKENFGNALVEGVANGLLPVVYDDTHWSVLLKASCAMSEDSLKNELLNDSRDGEHFQNKFQLTKKLVISEFIRGNDFKQVLDKL